MSYHAYAGIGSRETPKPILRIMHHLGAYLCSEGWTLRSGGAPGADTAFEMGVDAQVKASGSELIWKEIYLPWKGFNNSTSAFHPDRIPFSQEEVDFTASYHPAWDKCSPSAKRLHVRNTRQILGTEFVNGPTVVMSKMVICWTPGGAMKGGTSQALRIAQALNIPIINLGSAGDNHTLEQLVLKVDELQRGFKEQTNDTIDARV